MAQDYSQVNFRIPTKLKEQIEQSSLTNNRSITAELVSRLEKSFENDYKINKFREVEKSEMPKESIVLLMNVLEAFDYLMDKKETPD